MLLQLSVTWGHDGLREARPGDRSDCVAVDVVLVSLYGQRVCQTQHAQLRCAVVGLAKVTVDAGGWGRHDDSGPSRGNKSVTGIVMSCMHKHTSSTHVMLVHSHTHTTTGRELLIYVSDCKSRGYIEKKCLYWHKLQFYTRYFPSNFMQGVYLSWMLALRESTDGASTAADIVNATSRWSSGSSSPFHSRLKQYAATDQGMGPDGRFSDQPFDSGSS